MILPNPPKTIQEVSIKGATTASIDGATSEPYLLRETPSWGLDRGEET